MKNSIKLIILSILIVSSLQKCIKKQRTKENKFYNTTPEYKSHISTESYLDKFKNTSSNESDQKPSKNIEENIETNNNSQEESRQNEQKNNEPEDSLKTNEKITENVSSENNNQNEKRTQQIQTTEHVTTKEYSTTEAKTTSRTVTSVGTTSVPVPKIKQDDITNAVLDFCNNSEKSQNELVEKVKSTIKNALKDVIDETDRVFANVTGPISKTIAKIGKTILNVFADMVESINDKIVDVLDIPIKNGLGNLEKIVKTGSQKSLDLVSTLNTCVGKEFTNLTEKSLKRIADCVPKNAVDQNDINELLSHVDSYVDYITQTPTNSLDCVKKGIFGAGSCFTKLSLEITTKSTQFGATMAKDGVNIGQWYTKLGTNTGACYAQAISDITKDYSEAGINAINCGDQKNNESSEQNSSEQKSSENDNGNIKNYKHDNRNNNNGNNNNHRNNRNKKNNNHRKFGRFFW